MVSRGLGLFVLGLLSKTVIATLPAALLVVFWWQRGRLSWRRNMLPLVPFFVLGTVAGEFTAWVEQTNQGPSRRRWKLTAVERCLIAGRVIWFYLWKLFWPAELLFIYPRWQIEPGGMVAIPFPRWRRCCSWSVLGPPAAVARPFGGIALLRRHVVPGAWASATCFRSSFPTSPITSSTWRAWGSSRWCQPGPSCC